MKKKLTAILCAALCCILMLSCTGGTAGGGNAGGGNAGGGQTEVPVDYWKEKVSFGISVDENGTMWLGDSKLYMAGSNCYNLFNQCFEDDFSAQKAKASLDVLKANNVGVVRFNCGGYGMSWINEYHNNKQKYLALLGEIAEYAEQLEIGLIPSFFWLYHSVPDYYDEVLRSWGREGSKTITFIRDYTHAVVMEIKDYKSVFAWELGNELNLSCDLPNAAEHMPALPQGSLRTERTEDDYLSAEDVNFAIKEFSKVIKSCDDTGRMITTGNATLRASQYNQYKYFNWNQDTEDEYAMITSIFTPDGVDCISEHVYFTSQNCFGRTLSVEEYLEVATATAKELKKAYFVGEWAGGDSLDYDYYHRIGHAFVDAGVQLALIWNFNLEENSVEYSFSAGSERGQMLLGIVSEMNYRYKTIYQSVE